MALAIQDKVPVLFRDDAAFRDLPSDAALAWCKYLGLQRGEDKAARYKVLVEWFKQRPGLGQIYRVTPETACPCLDCLHTGEGLSLDMADTVFNKKVGGGHEGVRPPHRA